MKLNPAQRKALFEKLKTNGKLKPPNMNMMAAPKPPKAPSMPQMASTKTMTDADKVNENYIGKTRPARFKKIRSMFGL